MGKPVKVIEKAFHILEILSDEKTLSLKKISEITKLPKPTASRILDTMQGLGYIEQDSSTLQFQLGAKLLSLSRNNGSASEIITIAEPYLKKLYELFGETVNLARLHDSQIIYIRILESNNAFRFSDTIGDYASIHSTAIGKSLSAFLPEDKLNELIEKCEFTSFTKKTITDKEDLRRHLKQVRHEGYAIDNEEGHDGVICIGAPIFNKDNLPFAAMSISVPKVRCKSSTIQKLAREISKVSIQISLELGVTDIRKCLDGK
ncbi:MAG: IclR family transcriptional regulator [Bacteroidetes bacterium]|nr:IclR family transcriptional regulator [Bacteroidota bacterium]